MKKIFLMFEIVCFFISYVIINADDKTVKTIPLKPKPTDEITITFSDEGTPVSESDKIYMNIFYASANSEKWGKIDTAYCVEMKKTKHGWQSKLKPYTSTDLIALSFSNDVVNETNDGKGYFIRFYDANGNVSPASNIALAACLSNWGRMCLGYDLDAKLAYKIMNEVFITNPEFKTDYFGEYLGAMYGSLTKEDYHTQLLIELESLSSRTDLKDETYSTMINYYKSLKMSDKANEIESFASNKYPKGFTDLVRNLNLMRAEKELTFKLELALKIEKDFSGNKKNILGYSYLIEELLKEQRFDLLNDMLNRSKAFTENFTLNYNLVSSILKANKGLDIALVVAEKTIMLGRKELTKSIALRNSFETEKTTTRNRKNSFNSFLFKYGELLIRMNKKEEALKILDEAVALISINDIQSDNILLYAKLLMANSQNEKALAFIESILLNGKSNDKIKSLLKEIYIQKNGSEKGFTDYVTDYSNLGKKEALARLKKSMLNKIAPNFTLKDASGKKVSIKEYKGKIVIIDFWATWCGYCKKSFPGMQKLVNQHKDNNDVVFLFIDTQEIIPNPEKAVQAFLTENKYSFYVLFDSNSNVVSDFKVTGLPTKVVVDKTGITRFQVAGYNGDEIGMIEEINNMIEILK
jgi:thiol-disulfide isomerase/thioredoxin